MTNLDVHLPAIAAGDDRAFARWLAQAEYPLRASLRSFASSVDVEAVVQETLLRVWQVAPKFEPDGKDNGLLRLAIRIGRNLAISEVRRLRTRPVEPEQIEERVADAHATETDPLLRRLIEMCRERLPERPSAALMARLVGGFTNDADLAASIGMKKNTFLQNFGRARKMLETCLEKQGVKVRESAS